MYEHMHMQLEAIKCGDAGISLDICLFDLASAHAHILSQTSHLKSVYKN